ncbi:ABC-type multidrug transport system, ATPase component [Actinopolymorpha cephalotaxi]|uniref:ABC-type multidrug transport system ATPase subunit n=1 Tax=Actinopolymorpha cephalotaxi TaxID=504797 RepID=A0A1I2W9C4_9ACTN|nr:ATP-binding cassette domain-containing protein [Actinopolymorpha cephalotaxi]NYH82765.1 ABC-type multidrug transport system ATPase subunit [Actinopolymorpha cephalotaxi]SFG96111.1 ABC-type multidrug transport system, ATPase component [Actinopolymorpha cephalotaxi]
MRLLDVHARYPAGDDWVLRGVEAELRPGDTIVVTGRNGAGKSTLLRALAGLTPIGRGRVLDRPAVVGWLPDKFPTDQRFSAAGYLRAMGQVRGLARADADVVVARLAERLQLTDYLPVPLAELSQGTGRKVALVQALLIRPGLLILDEPWEGLDAPSQAELPALVGEVAEAGGICVVTDHRGRSADLGSTRRWTVRDGRVEERPLAEQSPGLDDLSDPGEGDPEPWHVIEVVVRAHDPAAEVARLRAAGYDIRRVRGEA